MKKEKNTAGKTPLIYSKELKCFLKLECNNPSGSHKDRETLYLTRLFGENKQYIIASSGNAGISLAYWMRENATVVVPEITPKAKIGNIERHGSKIIISGKYYPEAYEKAEEIAKQMKLINVSPRRVERWRGDIQISYELGNSFDVIFVPSSNHTLARGIAYGFQEMKENNLIRRIPTVVSCVLPDHPFKKLVDTIDGEYQRIFNSIYTYGGNGKSLEHEFLKFSFTKVASTVKLKEVLRLSELFPDYDPAVWLALYIAKKTENRNSRKAVIVTGVKR